MHSANWVIPTPMTQEACVNMLLSIHTASHAVPLALLTALHNVAIRQRVTLHARHICVLSVLLRMKSMISQFRNLEHIGLHERDTPHRSCLSRFPRQSICQFLLREVADAACLLRCSLGIGGILHALPLAL